MGIVSEEMQKINGMKGIVNKGETDIDTLIIVYVTCNSDEEGSRLADLLIREHLAACVNILPVKSTYSWEGKIEQQSEQLLIIKSIKSRFEALRKAVKNNHSYENPEIIAIDVSDATDDYINWVINACKDND